MNSGLMGSSWVLGFPGEDEPSQKSEDVSTRGSDNEKVRESVNWPPVDILKLHNNPTR